VVNICITFNASCGIKTLGTRELTGLALEDGGVFVMVESAEVLTLVGSEVKVGVGLGTLPGFHVKHCGGHFRKPTIP
jgi:hypothetical protein